MRFHRFELRKSNGNLSNTVAGVLGDWSYTYDAQNRLIRAVGGPLSVVAEFYYDARNRCVRRVINGVTTYLIYDGWSLLEERNLAGNLLARYYHGPVIDELLCRVTETNTVYYHHDGLGSTVALTDSTGSVVESYTYDVYGQPSILSTTYQLLPTSSVTNRFLFTGREYLADLALYDYRHRFYSPSLGRFLQTDPIRFDADDVNLYEYVDRNPALFTDPTGELKTSTRFTTAFPQPLPYRALPLYAEGTGRGLGDAAGMMVDQVLTEGRRKFFDARARGIKKCQSKGPETQRRCKCCYIVIWIHASADPYGIVDAIFRYADLYDEDCDHLHPKEVIDAIPPGAYKRLPIRIPW